VYTILVALGVGIVAGAIWTLLGLWKTWAFGIVLGTVVSVATFAIISRRIGKRVEPVFEQIQRQVQGGNPKLALKTLQELMPLARWQVLLRGQLYAQMGSLCFTMDDDARALEYLGQASPRLADGQLFLASLYYRKKDVAKAKEILATAIRYNKKQIILYNAYAWILNKEGDRDGAIQQLLRCLKVEKSNELTKDNLQRVQNGKKMNMRKFGMTWYGLQFEKLPASMRQGQTQITGRKGFRQKKRRAH
jgi:tetratricopeptide (TPR) repeat protein